MAVQRGEPLWFVGVDFGTTFSGYAVTTLHSDSIQLQYTYSADGLDAHAEKYPKTPTALLYKASLEGGSRRPELVAWGWAAESKYQGCDRNDRKDYMLAQKFKLALCSDDDAPSMLSSFWGSPQSKQHGVTGQQAITDFMRELRKHAVQYLTNSHARFDESRTRWTFTVPASWSDSAKHEMRQAASTAGFAPDNVLLVHEPEAAAIAAVHKKAINVQTGDTFMIVDAGGGTVDITLHKVNIEMGRVQLSDIAIRRGDNAGSTFLDDGFEKYIAKLVGEDVYMEWSGNPVYAKQKRTFMSAWEASKKAFSSGSKDIKLEFPVTLIKMAEFSGDVLDDFGEITLTHDTMQAIFDKQVDTVLVSLRQMLAEADVDGKTQILVVGGFGSNKYLQEKIKQCVAKLAPGTSVVAPPDGYAYILEGAALYAKCPTIIAARMSRSTYGVRTCAPQEPDSPDIGHFMHEESNRPYNNKFFSQYVAKGAQVKAEEVVKRVFSPLYRNARSVSFDIYCTTRSYGKYVTEPGMRQVGSCTIDIADPSAVKDPSSYDIVVSFKFGEAELQITAVDQQTQKEASTSILYD